MTKQTFYAYRAVGAPQPVIFVEKESRDRVLPARAVPFEFEVDVPEARMPTPKNMSEVITGLVDSVGWRTLMWTGMGWTGMDVDGNNRTWEDKHILEWREFRVGTYVSELLETLVGRMDVQELGKLVDPLAWDEEAYQDYNERTELQTRAMSIAQDVVRVFVSQVAPND
jgi:hypothetical protein